MIVRKEMGDPEQQFTPLPSPAIAGGESMLPPLLPPPPSTPRYSASGPPSSVPAESTRRRPPKLLPVPTRAMSASTTPRTRSSLNDVAVLALEHAVQQLREQQQMLPQPYNADAAAAAAAAAAAEAEAVGPQATPSPTVATPSAPAPWSAQSSPRHGPIHQQPPQSPGRSHGQLAVPSTLAPAASSPSTADRDDDDDRSSINTTTNAQQHENGFYDMALEEHPLTRAAGGSNAGSLTDFFSYGDHAPSRWRRLWLVWKRKAVDTITSDQAKYAIKETLAYLLCALLVLIDPVRNAFGSAVGTVPSVLLMTKVSGTVGLNVRNGVVLVLGTLTGGLLGEVTVQVSGTSDVVLLIFMFVFSAILIFIKSLKVSWQPGANMAVTTYVSIILTNPNSLEPGDNYSPLTYTFTTLLGMITGIFICTFVSVTVFPTSAAAQFDDQMKHALSVISDLVNLSILRALHGGDAPEMDFEELRVVASKARSAVRKLKDLQAEAKWEFRSVFWFYDEHTRINETLQHMVRLASAMEEHGTSISFNAALGDVSHQHIQMLKTTLLNLQQRFRIYAVDLIPVLYDKGYITDEGQEQINGLTALLNEFDDHIKNMVLPMGHDQDVGAVNFKMIAFRELVTELVILVDEVIEIQTVKKTYKEVFRSLAQEAINISPLVQPDNLVKIVDDDRIKANSWLQRLRFKLSDVYTWANSMQVKFAVKVSAAMTMLAIGSFAEGSSSFFSAWGLDWALIVLVYISVPTFGGSINASLARMSGVAIGSAFTMAAWTVVGWNPVASFFLIALYNPVFQFLRLGSRFNLVGTQAINALTAMYLAMYVMGPDSTMTVQELIARRAFGIFIAVTTSLVIGRLVWPYLARHELRKTISGILQRLSILYSVLQGHVDSTMEEFGSISADVRQFEGVIQSMIIDSEKLLDTSTLEPRLVAPLKIDLYKKTIRNVQHLLDHLSCLRVLLARGISAELLEQLAQNRALVQAIAAERQEQTVDMLLFFYILSAAIVFKTPLPYYLPNVKKAIDRAFKKWRKLIPHPTSNESLPLDVPQGQGYLPPPRSFSLQSHFSTALVYAYATNLRDLASILEEMGGDFKQLFGVNSAMVFGDDFRKPFSSVSLPSFPLDPIGSHRNSHVTA